MKVQNMTNSKGRKVSNQFIITGDIVNGFSENSVQYFQSYDKVIAKRDRFRPGIANSRQIWLDRENWDYSKTTGKYRNQFLGETKRETQKKIDSGEYILTDLNQ